MLARKNQPAQGRRHQAMSFILGPDALLCGERFNSLPSLHRLSWASFYPGAFSTPFYRIASFWRFRVLSYVYRLKRKRSFPLVFYRRLIRHWFLYSFFASGHKCMLKWTWRSKRSYSCHYVTLRTGHDETAFIAVFQRSRACHDSGIKVSRNRRT